MTPSEKLATLLLERAVARGNGQDLVGVLSEHPAALREVAPVVAAADGYCGGVDVRTLRGRLSEPARRVLMLAGV